MPSVFLHIQHPWISICIKNHPFSFITILVIENPRDLSSYDYYCF